MIEISAPTCDAGVLDFTDAEAAIEHCYSHSWTDGLPFILPTRQRVDGLLGAAGSPSSLVEDPRTWPRPGLTLRELASNAAMGGCLPQHFPVVLAAVEAMVQPEFALDRLLDSTGAWAPLVIVSGPAVRALGFNSRDGVFGGGSRANLAVGRSVRLIIWNLLRGASGGAGRSSFGHPGEHAFCIAEDPDNNPWEPFHVAAGSQLPAGSSAVTVFACEANHNVCDTHNDQPQRLLDMIADGLSTLGSGMAQARGQALVVAGPERARVFAAAGWSRSDVQRHLYEHSRRKLAEIRGSGASLPIPKWLELDESSSEVRIFEQPEDILVTVAGGDGPHSVICPGVGGGIGKAVVRRIVQTEQGEIR